MFCAPSFQKSGVKQATKSKEGGECAALKNQAKSFPFHAEIAAPPHLSKVPRSKPDCRELSLSWALNSNTFVI